MKANVNFLHVETIASEKKSLDKGKAFLLKVGRTNRN